MAASALRRAGAAIRSAIVVSCVVVGAGEARAAAPESSRPAAPQLRDGETVETANGAQLLRWAPAPGEGEAGPTDYEYELQESSAGSFDAAVTRYRGTMPSYYVSGRRDGSSQFRVRARAVGDAGPGPWSAWSSPMTLVVAHHDPRLALGLFGLGALVFAITAATVAAGARHNEGAP